MDRRWVRKLLRSPEASRIAEFRLELDTLDWKVDQLRPIVEKLKLAGEPKEGEDARWELVDPCDEITWSGPVNLAGHHHYIYEDREKLDYRVITLKWRRCKATDVEQRWQEAGSLLTLCEPPRARAEEDRSWQDEGEEEHDEQESEHEPESEQESEEEFHEEPEENEGTE